MFIHGNSAMLRVTDMLEEYTEDYIHYSYYVSETGHQNIAFECEAILKFLLEEAEGGSVSICFILNFVEVYSITKRGNILTGTKSIDKGTKHSGSKEKLCNY